MAVSVNLAFVPPDRPDMTKLYILEAPTINAALTPVETVLAIGTYPDYITRYTTALATSVDDFFAIQWEDSKGAKTDISERVKGETLVGKVVQRAQQRDRSLDEHVVVQEAEAAIEFYFGENPYLVDAGTLSYQVLNGLVYLVLARALIARSLLQSSAQSVTIGMVSTRSSDTQLKEESIQRLLNLANRELGIATSLAMQIDDVHDHYGGRRSSQTFYDVIPWVIIR